MQHFFFGFFYELTQRSKTFFMCVNVLCQQQVNCTGVPHVAHSKMPLKKGGLVNSIWEID